LGRRARQPETSLKMNCCPCSTPRTRRDVPGHLNAFGTSLWNIYPANLDSCDKHQSCRRPDKAHLGAYCQYANQREYSKSYLGSTDVRPLEVRSRKNEEPTDQRKCDYANCQCDKTCLIRNSMRVSAGHVFVIAVTGCELRAGAVLTFMLTFMLDNNADAPQPAVQFSLSN